MREENQRPARLPPRMAYSVQPEPQVCVTGVGCEDCGLQRKACPPVHLTSQRLTFLNVPAIRG